MNRHVPLILAFVVPILLCGCNIIAPFDVSSLPPGDSGTDGDSDTDADAETDADDDVEADVEPDADTDADGDEDADVVEDADPDDDADPDVESDADPPPCITPYNFDIEAPATGCLSLDEATEPISVPSETTLDLNGCKEFPDSCCLVTTPGGASVALFVVTDMDVEGRINLRGDQGYVFLASGVVEISGTIDLSADGTTPGPGGAVGGDSHDLEGGQGRWPGATADTSGGGGGGNLGAGGDGGGSAAGGAGDTTCTASTLDDLWSASSLGGSGGGGGRYHHGVATDGGAGGGYIQIYSASSITLTSSGSIAARGGHGDGNTGILVGSTGGGGSGGTVILESPAITLVSAYFYLQGGNGGYAGRNDERLEGGIGAGRESNDTYNGLEGNSGGTIRTGGGGGSGSLFFNHCPDGGEIYLYTLPDSAFCDMTLL